MFFLFFFIERIISKITEMAHYVKTEIILPSIRKPCIHMVKKNKTQNNKDRNS